MSAKPQPESQARFRRLPARNLAAGLLVVGVAGWLRLGWPGVNNFGFDEAYLSRLALELATSGRIPTVGMPASVPVPNFPGAAWVMAIPYLISHDPLAATLFVGLLNTAAVAAVFWLTRSGWDLSAGISAGLLAATSPPWVLHARSIWAQNLMAPLSVLWAVAAFTGFGRNRRWSPVIFGFVAGFGFQVHYSGLALIPASLALLALFQPGKRLPAVIAGFALAGLATLPFIISALCCRPEILAGVREVLGRPTVVDLESFRQWAGLIRGDDNLGGAPVDPGWTGSLVLLLAALGLGRLGLEAARNPDSARRLQAALILVWALAPPIFFLAHSTPLYPNYQLMALPAAFTAAGAAVASLPGRWVRLAATAAVITVAANQAAGLVEGFNRLAAGLPVSHPFSRPLFLVREAAGAVKDGWEVIVVAPGDAPEFDPDAAISDVLLWGYPHRIVDGRSALLIPAAGGRMLITSPDLPALQELEAAGFRQRGRAEFGRGGWPPVVVLSAEKGPPAGFTPFGPVPLAGDIEYVGYRWRRVGDRWRLTSLWQVNKSQPPEILQQFHHLRAGEENGPVVIIQDVRTSSRVWQAGDLVVVWADFAGLPGRGPFWVDTGLYEYPSIRRLDRLDMPANPQAPIRLGPFYTD
jgi:hypothetical protein